MRCTYCGSYAHEYELCPKTWAGSIARRNLYCTYCGAHDHSIEACRKTFSGNAARAWDENSVSKFFVKDGQK